MPASKVVNEQEVIGWFAEGRTYQWMIEEYERKYNTVTTHSMWGNFRRRRGLERRITRDDDLIPWLVRKEHRWDYPLAMLRVEARHREGRELTESDAARLKSWKEMLAKERVVVHYDPDTEKGFFYIPPQEGDDDIIHRPPRKTTPRPNADKS